MIMGSTIIYFEDEKQLEDNLKDKSTNSKIYIQDVILMSIVVLINIYFFFKLNYYILPELYSYTIYLQHISKKYKFLKWLNIFVSKKLIKKK